MSITFTVEERQFLRNILIERMQDGSKETDRLICGSLFNKLLGEVVNLTGQEVGFAQYLMQEMSEIWGRSSSVANEKQPIALHSFVPQHTRILIQNVGAKLGAKLPLDTESRGDVLSPRSEGSSWIMTDVTKDHIG